MLLSDIIDCRLTVVLINGNIMFDNTDVPYLYNFPLFQTHFGSSCKKIHIKIINVSNTFCL